MDLEHAGILVAEDELDLAVLRRLEPARRTEHVAELAVLGRGQGLEDAPLRDQLRLDVLHPREDLERRLQVVGLHVADGGAKLVEQELEPQLRRLVLDDEEHLVVMDRLGERLLRREELIELQVARVRHPIGEVGDDVRVETFRHGRILRRRFVDGVGCAS